MLKSEYNIGIIGCGKMGTNIFQFLNDFPFRLVLICKSEELAEQKWQTFKRKLDRSFKHGLIDQQDYNFRTSNTVISHSLAELKDCNLVIESISEDLKLKKVLFQKLDQIVSETCILASNSSSIQPSELISSRNRKHNTIGLHFFYPITFTDLVEVNTTNSTSVETVAFLISFLNEINKFHLIFSETSNFTINKMFLKLQAGCCYLHQHYNLSYANIDALVKEKLFPVGIFEFIDHVGVDTMLFAVKNYLNKIDDVQFYEPLIDELNNLNNQGKLGRKSGDGFYQYQDNLTDESSLVKNSQFPITTDEISNMLHQWYLEPLYQLVSNSVCTKAEIDHIVKEYLNADQSPFDLANQIGYKISN